MCVCVCVWGGGGGGGGHSQQMGYQRAPKFQYEIISANLLDNSSRYSKFEVGWKVNFPDKGKKPSIPAIFA